MFQFPKSCLLRTMYSSGDHYLLIAGLPHSEISGSQLDYSSPKLIAVSHVLLRLLMPRHSPFALSSLALFHKYYQLKTLCLRCLSYPNLRQICHTPYKRCRMSPHPLQGRHTTRYINLSQMYLYRYPIFIFQRALGPRGHRMLSHPFRSRSKTR